MCGSREMLLLADSNALYERYIRDKNKARRLLCTIMLLEAFLAFVFAVVCAVIVFACLKRKYLTPSLDRGVEITALVVVALFLMTFFAREGVMARYRDRLEEQISHAENVLASEGGDSDFQGTIEILRKEREAHSRSTVAKVTTAISLFSAFASLVLEILLVIDLYRPFGMQTAHGNFVAKIEDACWLALVLLSLFCISLHLGNHYYTQRKERQKAVAKGEKAAASSSSVVPVTLWISFLLLIINLASKVIRALENTKTLSPISVGDGLFMSGYFIGIFVCFAECIILLLDESHLFHPAEPVTALEVKLQNSAEASHQGAAASFIP